jgi:transposase-like protein
MTAAIMDLHRAGTPVRQIAGALKVSTQHVYRTLERFDVRPNPPDSR